MPYPNDRVILFDRHMSPLRELSPDEVFSRVRSEEVNGEHSLVITTTRRLEEGWRALTVDGMGKWREWVVTETDEEHESGAHAIGTYHLVWSLQYDLTRSYSHTHDEIGYGNSPIDAQTAAGLVLRDVPYWTVGACDAADIEVGKGAVFIFESAWSRLEKTVECFDCEVDAEIVVSNLYNVTARRLRLLAHLGNEEALRRFDWGEDVTNIKRTPDPGPYYCRVVPLGKGEQEYAEDDETTFDWPTDITEETGVIDPVTGECIEPGPYWIQDDDAAAVFCSYDEVNDEWFYPTIAVTYSSEDDPELLLKAAMEELHKYTRPGVTYEANVLQFQQAGLDVHGIALGDEVQCVDRGFNPDAALRIQGRVARIEVDELSPEATMEITIGDLRDNMTDVIVSVNESLDALLADNSSIRSRMASMTTARYVDELLDRMNTEIAATGGYTYIVPGEGIITYDIAVDDPLVGYNSAMDEWAGQVVQIKGGSIRIANSRSTPFVDIDSWNFRSVFTSGHILADLITAAMITSGYIGNATNSNYWNLDTGELILRMPFGWWGESSATSNKYLKTMNGYVATGNMDYYYKATGNRPVDTQPGDTAYIPGFKVAKSHKYTTVSETTEVEDSYILLLPFGEDSSGYGTLKWNSIMSSYALHIMACLEDSAQSTPDILLRPNKIRLSPFGEADTSATYFNKGLEISTTRVGMGVTPAQSSTSNTMQLEIDSSGVSINDGLSVNDDLLVYGETYTQSLKVNTHFSMSFQSSASNCDARFSRLHIGTLGDTGGYDGGPGDGTLYTGRILIGRSDTTNSYGTSYVYGNFTVGSGYTKNKTVETKDYGEHLLYTYETSSPMFGDIGSGMTDEDGYAYVSIDDVFAETVRTDCEYQVFLQKCGPGDIWVEEKTASYFVVHGTPNLAFDWELKARQTGFENLRLDETNLREFKESGPREANELTDELGPTHDFEQYVKEYVDDIDTLYDDDPISDIERIYDEELSAA